MAEGDGANGGDNAGHRARLRGRLLTEAGLLLPGRHRRRHLLASLEVRDDPKLASRAGDVSAPWADLVTEALAWSGDVLISHEFFGPASSDQVRRAVESLVGAEVHVIITAREMVGLAISREIA